MHGVQQLITVTLNILASPKLWSQTEEAKVVILMHHIFQLTEVYNSVLETSFSPAPEANSAGANNSSQTSLNSMNPFTKPDDALTSNPNSTKQSGGSVHVLIQINAANRNDSALLKLSLKPFNGTRLLQIMAQKRASFASYSFSHTIISNFYANSTGVLTTDKFETCFAKEDSGLNPIGKGFSQCPSLLGRAAVKKTENGDQRLSRSTRTKMYSYFHEILWTLTGENAEDLLLWGTAANVPLVLHPLETFFALQNALALGQHFQGANF